MPEKVTNLPDLQLLQVGGMDERSSISTTPQNAFRLVQGLYPNNANAQQRIPGKILFSRLGSSVWNIHQTFVGGNVLVQTKDALYMATLDELFDRSSSPLLTPYPAENEDTMAYALIVAKKTAGTDGGALGASSNTFYKRELTTEVVDDGSIVSFDDANDQFTLAAGTYRFSIAVIGCNIGSHVAKLRDVTTPQDVGIGTFASCQNSGTTAGTYVQNASFIECRYTIATGTKTFEIQHSGSNNTSATVARGFSVAGPGVEAYYLICKIIKE